MRRSNRLVFLNGILKLIRNQFKQRIVEVLSRYFCVARVLYMATLDIDWWCLVFCFLFSILIGCCPSHDQMPTSHCFAWQWASVAVSMTHYVTTAEKSFVSLTFLCIVTVIVTSCHFKWKCSMFLPIGFFLVN